MPISELVHSIKMSSKSVVQCPRCGANVTPAQAKTYWAVAAGLKSKGLDVHVETECCQKALTLEQVKALHWGRKRSASAWGRKLSKARKTFGAGTGRPQVKTPCPFCKEEFGARELREHKPRCPKKPT